jgi:uncharacterized protein YdaU (DUF1376 family)
MTGLPGISLSSTALWRTGRRLPPDDVYLAIAAFSRAKLARQLAVRSTGAQH